jgi:hypothetical protein
LPVTPAQGSSTPAKKSPIRGAEDEVRTRDLQLGRLSLYQLSYFRILPFFGASGRRRSCKELFFLPPLSLWHPFYLPPLSLWHQSGQGWIRTTELVRGQIYSLLPLATWLLAQKYPE